MMMDVKLATRVFFGLLMASGLILLLIGEGWFSATQLSLDYQGLVFSLAAAIVGCAGLRELIDMARDSRFIRVGWILYFSLVAVLTSSFWAPPNTDNVVLAGLMSGTLFVAALCQGMGPGANATFKHLGFVSFGFIYLVIGFYFMVEIRLLGAGLPGWADQIGPVITYLAIVKFADVGAYLTGRAIGKHKWVPSISPNKTWEGLAGGIVLGIIAAIVSNRFFTLMTDTKAILLGIIIGVTGQLGDLLESMLKRDSQVKDSAKMVPEFGGMLDIIDSPIVAAPVAYLLYSILL